MINGTKLRSIALTVREERPGCFTWVLLESRSGSTGFETELAKGEFPFSSFSEAVRAGSAVLTSLASRSAHGPRMPVDEEQSAREARLVADEQEHH